MRQRLWKMGKAIRQALANNVYFHGFSLIALLMLVASFLVPPVGVIDPSCLAAVGEIFAFAALGTVIKAIDAGLNATVQHNGTSVTVSKDQEEEMQEEAELED